MLTEHIKIHLKSKMIKCPTCGKQILENKQDEHNLKHHTAEKDAEHWCKPCAESFITASALERHNAERHEDAEKVDCPKCGRTMTNASYETHRKLAGEADPPSRRASVCLARPAIGEFWRKTSTNTIASMSAMLRFLDTLPVLEAGDERMESDDENINSCDTSC